jgi:putative sterol carrier protein
MGRTRPRNFFCQITIILAVFEISPVEAAIGALDSTPQQVFDGMARNFRAEKAKGMHVRYQFDLSGPNGGSWFFDVNDGSFRTKRGKIDNPNVTLVASDQDWVALSNGQLSGPWAFMTGRLKIRGDHGLAKKLREIFP